MNESERRNRCTNCGGLPQWKKSHMAIFRHMIVHNTPTCPKRFEGHNNSRSKLAGSWNEFNSGKMCLRFSALP